MTARRDAVAATRRRVLAAVRDLAFEDLDLTPTLDDVAGRAGVSVQTVLRHFTTRDALLAEAAEAARLEIVAQRRPPSRDVDSALATLIEHYELRGDLALALVAQETSSPAVAALAETGKTVHRTWVEAVFADALPRADHEREAVLDLLVVATDVHTWRLLRRDRGLPVDVVRARMRALTDAVLASRP
jgi:AcrR family transcriptional regulator